MTRKIAKFWLVLVLMLAVSAGLGTSVALAQGNSPPGKPCGFYDPTRPPGSCPASSRGERGGAPGNPGGPGKGGAASFLTSDGLTPGMVFLIGGVALMLIAIRRQRATSLSSR